MAPIYKSGDVVFFKNVKLYRKNKPEVVDTRINGHPFIILEDVNDFGEYALCLLCSSTEGAKPYKKRYLIKKLTMNGRTASSVLVNWEYVYKIKVTSFPDSKGRILQKDLHELKKLVSNKLEKLKKTI